MFVQIIFQKLDKIKRISTFSFWRISRYISFLKMNNGNNSNFAVRMLFGDAYQQYKINLFSSGSLGNNGLDKTFHHMLFQSKKY